MTVPTILGLACNFPIQPINPLAFLYLLDGAFPTSLHLCGCLLPPSLRSSLSISVDSFCLSELTASSPHLQQPPNFSPHFPDLSNFWGVYMESHLFQAACQVSPDKRARRKPGLATCYPLPATSFPLALSRPVWWLLLGLYALLSHLGTSLFSLSSLPSPPVMGSSTPNYERIAQVLMS